MKRRQKNRKGKHSMIVLLSILLGLIFFITVIFWARSISVNNRLENQEFIGGLFPEPALDGTYKGNTQSRTGWQGKWFESSKHKGINNFSDGNRYEFKTSSDKSLSSDKKVLKLDYNNPGNPLWLRLIVDEISQVEDNKYQGKVYVKIGPMFFTLTYFELSNR